MTPGEAIVNTLVDEIIESSTHPNLIVSIEAKQPFIRATIAPFERAGFSYL